MKLICAIIAMATIATSVTANQIKNVKSSQSNKIEKNLRRLSGQWLHAIAQRDTVALNNILAEEVIITDAVGKMHNKAEELVLRGSYVHNTGYNNTVENVRFYGDAAVVTSLYTVRVQVPQKRVYWVEYRCTFVWSKQGERWQIVAQQFTRISGE